MHGRCPMQHTVHLKCLMRMLNIFSLCQCVICCVQSLRKIGPLSSNLVHNVLRTLKSNSSHENVNCNDVFVSSNTILSHPGLFYIVQYKTTGISNDTLLVKGKLFKVHQCLTVTMFYTILICQCLIVWAGSQAKTRRQ